MGRTVAFCRLSKLETSDELLFSMYVLIAEDEVAVTSDYHHVSAEWEVEWNVGGLEFTCVEGKKGKEVSSVWFYHTYVHFHLY